MTIEVDVFWSFRSPYSYLATPRFVSLQREYDLQFNIRPVYPLAVRVADFFKNTNPKFAFHVVFDSKRVADKLGMDFAWPSPDPIAQNMVTREVEADQPYITRLTQLGQAASDAGKGVPFIFEVSSLIFGGTRNWHEGDHLAKASERAGLDLAELDAAIGADGDGYEAKIETNHAALDKSAHWGVPTMVWNDETFFGQDRIDTLIWRLKQNGLMERS